ncbi:MAG: NAD-dependent epimerase/dehydratase family protein [Lachnospiraceae bacterium]|jgi:UDP-glucose 4-epimerase|nr:NAD-dependent epimerase/dehydratase family protein [Lachnospiraceae bacterium]
MRALVVGGAGFIGSHLCENLLKQGHKVACMDNFSLGTRMNVELLHDFPDFVLYEGDAANRESMRKIVREFTPEYIFHLAANSDIQASAANPDIEYRNTYSTTFEILSAMREYGVKRLFFASTSAVYGDKREVELDENTPDLAPVSYYGAAKLGSEALIHAFSYMNDMQALIFRFPNVIGPHLTHGVVFDFMKRLEQEPDHLRILGDGKQTKPYIYVTDLVDAILRFMETEKAGITLYNVGVEGDTCVTRIADIVCEEMGLHGVRYEYTGGEGGWKGDVPRFRYCLDRIHGAGWRARYSSDEAVRKTVQEVWKSRRQ